MAHLSAPPSEQARSYEGVLAWLNKRRGGCALSIPAIARLVFFAAWVGLAGAAQGSNLYWDGGTSDITPNGDGVSQGGDGTWDLTIKNWDQGSGLSHVAFTESDTAIFGGTPGTITSNLTALGLVFNADNYTISGANTLTIRAGGINANGNTAINSSLSLGAAQSWTTADGKVLTIGGAVNTNALLLTITGGGNTSISGVISGAGGLTKTGTGRLTLTGLSTYSGFTTINAGTLQIGDGATDGSIVGSNGIINNGSLLYNLAGGSTYSNVISGSGGLIKSGSGILTLTAGNTYSGQTTINAGTLQIGDGFAGGSIASSSSIANNGTLVFKLASSGTYGQVISGIGTLVKSGTGTLTLAGLNSYSGPTTINAGTLNVSADSALGAAPGTATPAKLLFANGTLAATESFTLNSNRGIEISSIGTLDVAAGSTLIYGGIAAGSGGLSKSGAGTLRLTGINTYTGPTRIDSGILQIGDGSTNGSVDAGSGIINNSALVYTVANNTTQTYSKIISGSGSLAKEGEGTLIFTGENSFSGPTTIHTGTLQLGNGTTNGSLGASDITNNGALVYRNPNGSSTYDRALGGTGTFIMDTGSAAALTLSGANTLSGVVIVKTGMLKLGAAGDGTNSPLGTTAAGTTVSPGATLDLNGVTLSTAETLTLSGMGISAAGALVNTDGTEASFSGPITLAADSSIGGEGHMTLSNVISGSSKALTKLGAGIVTLTGSNTYTGATTISAGHLVVNGSLAAASTVTVAAGATLSGAGIVGGTVAVANSRTAAITAGDGISGAFTLGNLTFNGAGKINIGDLANYTTSSALSILGNLTLKGSAGAVTLALSAQFLNNGTYHLISHSNSLANLAGFSVTGNAIGVRQSAILTNNSGMIDYVIADDSPYWTGDSGSAWNTSAANWRLITSDAETQFRPNDAVLFDDNATGTTTVDIATAVSPADTDFANSSLDYILQGAAGITKGSLTKTGAAKLTITNANSYSGGTTLNEGILEIGNNSALGTGMISLNGGTLSSDSTTTRTLSNAITIGGDITLGDAINNGALIFSGTLVDLGDAIRLLTVESDVTIAGVLTNGGFTKTGAGTLALTGSNTYTGDTTLDAGTLAINSARSLGDPASMITFSGDSTLRIDAAFSATRGYVINPDVTATIDTNGNHFTNHGIISGNGSLAKTGSGTLTLTGINTYTGPTTINAGMLEIGNGVTDGSITNTGSIENNGTLQYNLAGNQTYANLISGVGDLIKTGAGTLTLTGANTYTGLTLIQAGTLQLGDGVTDGSIENSSNVEINGTLIFNQLFDRTNNQALSGTGSLIKTGPGMLTLTGANSYRGGTTVYAGTLQITDGASLGDLSGSLVFAGNSTILLAGNVSSSSSYLINSDVTATFDTAGFSLGHNGTISGNGGLAKIGEGTLTLLGDNTYTGATTISAGTLSITADNGLGMAPASPTVGQLVLGGGTLALSGPSFDLAANRGIMLTAMSTLDVDDGTSATYRGIIEGSGGITKNGEGTLELYGRNTFNGGIILNAGTLAINTSLSLGSPIGGDLIFAGNGTLKVTEMAGEVFESRNYNIYDGKTATFDSNGNALTLAGTISGNGTLLKVGEGTLTLTGSNSYTGSTIVTSGTLTLARLAADNALLSTDNNKATTADILINGGTLNLARGEQISDAGSISLASGLLTFGGSGLTETVDMLTISGGVFSTGANTLSVDRLEITGGTNTVTENGTLEVRSGSGGGISFGGTDSPAIVLNSSNSTPGRLLLGQDIIVDSSLTAGTAKILNGGTATNPGTVDLMAGTRTFSINDGSDTVDMEISATITNGGIIKDGQGTLLLSGNNTYSGPTSIKAGMLEVGGAGNLGASTYLGDIDNAGTLAINTTADQTLAGVISGEGEITKDNTGTLILANANTFLGGTTLNSGAIQVGNDRALGTGLLTFNAGTISSDSTAARLLSNDLLIGGDITLGHQTNNGALTFAGANVDLGGDTRQITTASDVSISGDVTNGGLTKAGAGTLTLTGTSSYTGDTNVSSGVLAVSGVLSDTASISVASGATLKVNGSVNLAAPANIMGTLTGSGILGDVTIHGGGLLSPGNSPGIIRTGALEFSGSTARLVMEIGGAIAGTNYDQIITTGAVTLNNATLHLSLLNGYTPVATDRLLLILNGDEFQQDIGIFNTLADNSTISLTNDMGTFGFKIHYADFDANGTTDVYLSGPAKTSTPVKWGGAKSNPLAGILDGTRIPTTTGSNELRYFNVNDQGYDVVVVTKSLNKTGFSTLPWNNGSTAWWFEGGAASSGGQTIPYSTVEFHFYQTGTTIPIGLTGIQFRFEDAENGERFRNFGYWNSRGTKFTDGFTDPSIFTFSSGSPIVHLSDQNSIDSGSSYSGGTQEGRWIEVDLSPMAISGFTFQSGRYNSSAGSVLMTGLGDEVDVTSELLIQSGTDANVSAGPGFSATAESALLTPASITSALANSDVSIQSLDSQNITINGNLVSSSGYSLSMNTSANIVSLSSALNTSSTTGNAGAINLTATQSIVVAQLQAGASTGNGGNVNLTGGNNVKVTTTINTSSSYALGRGGDVTLEAAHDIIAGTIRSGGGVLSPATPGTVTLTAGDSIRVSGIYASSGVGSAVTLTAPSITLGKSKTVAADISGTMVLQKPAASSSASINISGTIAGTGSLVLVAGSGTANLNASTSHTGQTLIESGVLATHGNSLAGSDLILENTSRLLPGVTTAGGSVTVKSLTLGTNTTVNEKITSSSLFDQVHVSGVASLDGIFNLVLGFTPTLGAQFQVMTFASSTGVFGAWQGLRISEDLVLLPEFLPVLNPTSMWLVASSVPKAGKEELRTVPADGLWVSAGGSYDGLTTATPAGLITRATIIGGTASELTRVTMSLVATGTAGFQAGSIIRGYILNLEDTRSDLFVLELDYEEAAAIAAVGDERNMFVSSSDGGPFENAVNPYIGTSNPPKQFFRAYNPDTDFHLGYYGVDTVNNRVWAVLDHNSAFGLGVEGVQYALSKDGAIPVTEPASGLTATTATLNALVNPNGYPTTVFFEYGTESDLSGALVSPGTDLGNGSSLVTVSTPVANLVSGMTYYFRANAVTATGTQSGAIIQSSVTPPFPVVTVSASIADAYELGARCGQFVISQSGTAAVTVNYTLSGSATNGSRYTIPVGPVTVLPAGSSITLNVTPIPNNVCDGDQSAEITLTSGSDYAVASPRSAIVTIHDKPPRDQWRAVIFGADVNNPAISGDMVVNNGAGITNLMAYALGLNPSTASTAGLPKVGTATASGINYLALNFTRNAAAVDVSYTVQASSDLQNWSTVSTFNGGGWASADNIIESVSGSIISVQVRDTSPMTSMEMRFLRLQVSP